MTKNGFPDNTLALLDQAAAQIAALETENARLRLFLGEIAAMGPADEEWDADTLASATALAKRALSNIQ